MTTDKIVQQLLDIIVNHDKVVPDKGGFTPLSVLSTELSNKLQKEKEEYENALSVLPKYFDDELSIPQMRTLSTFIQLSNFKGSTLIIEAYVHWLRSHIKSEEKIIAEKKGVIANLVSNLGFHFGPDLDKWGIQKRNNLWVRVRILQNEGFFEAAILQIDSRIDSSEEEFATFLTYAKSILKAAYDKKPLKKAIAEIATKYLDDKKIEKLNSRLSEYGIFVVKGTEFSEPERLFLNPIGFNTILS